MRPLACALILLAAGCTSTTATSTSAPIPSTSAPSTTTPPPTTAATPVDPCPEGGAAGEFTEDGTVASLGTPAGDAAVISEIRLTTPRPGPDDVPDAPACERLVIDLATERGAPATAVGTTTVELLAGVGVVRISMPPQ